MSGIEVFERNDWSVRTVVVDGDPWFVGSDVCSALGFGGGARNALGRLPERMKGVAEINTPGGAQRMTTINEAGVYRLVMRSNLPAAESFQDWLAEEVVPSVRRTGGYTAMPQTYSAALRELASSVEARETAEAQVKALEPSAAAWEHLASAEGDHAVGDAAKMLSRDPSIKVGQNRLFTVMSEYGWVYRARGDHRWRTYQTAVESRLVSEIPQSHYHPQTGQLVLDPPQVRVTTKGLRELHRRLGGTAPLALSQQLRLEGAS